MGQCKQRCRAQDETGDSDEGGERIIALTAECALAPCKQKCAAQDESGDSDESTLAMASDAPIATQSAEGAKEQGECTCATTDGIGTSRHAPATAARLPFVSQLPVLPAQASGGGRVCCSLRGGAVAGGGSDSTVAAGSDGPAVRRSASGAMEQCEQIGASDEDGSVASAHLPFVNRLPAFSTPESGGKRWVCYSLGGGVLASGGLESTSTVGSVRRCAIQARGLDPEKYCAQVCLSAESHQHVLNEETFLVDLAFAAASLEMSVVFRKREPPGAPTPGFEDVWDGNVWTRRPRRHSSGPSRRLAPDRKKA
uniref:Uncharacterized protein n=1 Tax=Zooxanthella nutricula TaxID=1333877 RepID=A0A7S2JXG1_9DINO